MNSYLRILFNVVFIPFVLFISLSSIVNASEENRNTNYYLNLNKNASVQSEVAEEKNENKTNSVNSTIPYGATDDNLSSDEEDVDFKFDEQQYSYSNDINDNVSVKVLNATIRFNIVGVNNTIAHNIKSYLSTLPEIKRVNFSRRKDVIEEQILKAVSVYGYYNPQIQYNFRSKKSPQLDVYINLRKPMWVRKVDIVVLGEALTDPFFMSIFKTDVIKTYDRFDHQAYETLKSKIMSRALQLGYFDAHFIESKVYASIDENFADIRLVFNSSKGYTYKDIEFTGDVRYKPIIEPLINIKKNDKFSTYNLSNFSTNLYNTNYFQEAEVIPHIEDTEDHQVPITVNLKRRKFNNVELGLGYATDEGIRGKVNWGMPLINDYGHSINMQLELSRIRQEFLFRYTIPLKNPLLNYLYLLGSQTYDDLNDTDSIITSSQVHFIAKDIGIWTRDYGLIAQYEDYTQGLESGKDFIFGPVINFSTFKIMPRRDPREGYRYNLKIFASPKSIGSDKSFVQVLGQAKWVISPTINSRFVTRFEQGVNLGEDARSAPPSFRFFTGGDSTVRGFGYKVLANKDQAGYLKGGRYLSVGSMEIQVPVMEDLRSTLFYDIGTATNKYTNDTLYYSLGTGVRYISVIGIVKFDVAFGISETSIPFHFHFGIGPDI